MKPAKPESIMKKMRYEWSIATITAALLFCFGVGVQNANAQGSESFDNLNAPGNAYANGSFIGDNDIEWIYGQARTISSGDDLISPPKSIGFPQDEDEIRFVKANVEGGVGSITFTWRSYFTGGSASDRSVKVYVNEQLQGTFELENMDENFTETITDIDEEGFVEIEFRSKGDRQIALDDIEWTNFGKFPSEEIPYVFDFSENPFDNSWIQFDVLEGERSWSYNSDDERVDMNAFLDGQCEESEDWLISPPITLSLNGNELLNFTTSSAFGETSLKVLYSSDYNGFGNPNDANWTEIETLTPLDPGEVSDNDALQGINGDEIFIAFKYVNQNSDSECARWSVEEFSITEQIFLIYDFTGESESPTHSPPNATTSDFSISSGSVSFGDFQAGEWGGSGVPYAQSSGGWNQSSIESAKYFYFTIEPDLSYGINLSNISFDYRATGAGPDNLAVEINGEIIGQEIEFEDGEVFTFDTELTGFNDLSEVEVRIYGWDGGGGALRVNDVRLDGEMVEDIYFATLTGTEGFRMLSVPTEATYSDFLDPMWTQGADEGANISNGEPNVLLWNNDSDDGDSENWAGINNLTEIIPAGTGFLVYVYKDDETGEDGEFPKTLSVSGQENEPGFPADMNSKSDGFTLLGNPFAESLSFEDLERDNLTDVIYIWDVNDEEGDVGNGTQPDAGAGSWKSYSVSAGSGDITDGIIAPFQAFFVQNDNSTEASVTFNEEAKDADGEFLGKEAPASLVRLQLSGQGMNNATWVSFTDSGSMEQVRGDAHQLQPLSSNYALLSGKKNEGLFDISVLPQPGDDFEFPLSVDATIGGTYTLSVTDFDYSGSEPLFLVDRVKNKSLPLNGDLSYEFELDSPAQKKAVANPLALINRGPAKAVADEDEPRFVIAAGETVDAEAGADLPSELALSQNYPNPFNPTTKISYDVPEQQHVRLTVYDMLGRRVSVLVDENQSPGSHDVSWDASQLSSGVYIYRLEAGGQTLTRKMTLVK